MGGPSSNHDLGLLGIGPVLDDLFPNLQANLIDQAQDVPLSRLCIRSQHEIRGCKGEKMEGVAVDIMGGIEKLSKLFRCPRRICLVNGIYGLTRGHVMSSGSDAADPGNDPGKFLHGSPQTEDLKSSQLRDLEVSIFNVPLVVQKNLNLPVSF
jgi:hypothetical protein